MHVAAGSSKRSLPGVLVKSNWMQNEQRKVEDRMDRRKVNAEPSSETTFRRARTALNIR